MTIKKFKKKVPWIVFGIIVFLAFLARVFELSQKPFHHDESLHAYYSLRVALGSPHEYSALLHGPVLYYLVGLFLFMVKTIGLEISDFWARFPAAIFGTLLVAAPIFARRYLGWIATLVLCSLLAISPTLWYFGRFLREDIFVINWILYGLISWLIFWQTRNLNAAYFCAAFLAFHFVNKENSFLHAGIILLFFGLTAVTDQTETYSSRFDDTSGYIDSPVSKRVAWANIISIFGTIYILFYSSFFRHSKGALHGIIDGLYRESLLYWWNQNQIRRIDGPFDYHLPIIGNYEFLFLLPFLFAWFRLWFLAHKRMELDPGNSYVLMGGKKSFLVLFISLLTVILPFISPRIALVPEFCEHAQICVNDFGSLSTKVTKLAKLIHISNLFNILQIICYCTIGFFALTNALFIRRKLDAFLWFWLTASIGIYSYVGEKVPWLSVYIVLPLVLVSGLELGRILQREDLPVDDSATWFDRLPFLNEASTQYSKRLFWISILWIFVAAPATLYKGYLVAIKDPADPIERLVFTQTTPEVVKVRDRWLEAQKSSRKKMRVTMSGDATWPMAWYVHNLEGTDYVKPTSAKANEFDLMFLDDKDIDQLKQQFPTFAIYRLPLRAWWVPGVNPTVSQLWDYFLHRKIYPVKTPGPVDYKGLGSAKVLVLENTKGAYASLGPNPFLEKVWSP